MGECWRVLDFDEVVGEVDEDGLGAEGGWWRVLTVAEEEHAESAEDCCGEHED